MKFEAVMKTADGSVDATLKHRSMSIREAAIVSFVRTLRGDLVLLICVLEHQCSLASCAYAIVISKPKHFTLNFPFTLSHLYVPDQFAPSLFFLSLFFLFARSIKFGRIYTSCLCSFITNSL